MSAERDPQLLSALAQPAAERPQPPAAERAAVKPPPFQLKTAESAEEEPLEELSAGTGTADRMAGPLRIQPKLFLGAAGDAYEHEADAAARQVLQPVQRKPPGITPYQPASAPAALPDAAAQRILQLKGSGSPLPGAVRQAMEPRFGADFADVRVHTGPEAASLNAGLGAYAFTAGQDIFYGAGQAPAADALTAHELTHVLQQQGTPVVQRAIELDTSRTEESGFTPYISTATSLAGLYQDAADLLGRLSGHRFQSIALFTQQGMTIHAVGNATPSRTFPLRGSSMPPIGVYGLNSNGRIDMAGSRDGRFSAEQIMLDLNQLDPETQARIRARYPAESGGGASTHAPSIVIGLDDLVNATPEELQTHLRTPSFMIVAQLPASTGGSGESGGGTGGTAAWAQGQSGAVNRRIQQSRSSAASERNTAQDRSTPDRAVYWVRASDGRHFLNVFVGREVQSIELHEDQTDAELQARVERVTLNMRNRRQQAAEQAEQQITGGVPTNSSTYTGGGSGGATVNAPAYPASITGPGVMVQGGTGTFNMRLDYAAYAGSSLLAQVGEAFGGAEYIWELIDITALYQRIIRERIEQIRQQRAQAQAGGTPSAAGPTAGEQQLQQQTQGRRTSGSTQVGRMASSGRRLERTEANIREDERQALHDLLNPVSSGDGSAGSTISNVLVNTFNLATRDLHEVFSYGAWLVESIPAIFVLNQDYEREIPFPGREGFYLVRCIAQPRPRGRDGEVIHAASVAAKVVQVRNIETQVQSELRDQDANLEARLLELLLALRMTTDEAARRPILLELDIRVSEAAQASRRVLQTQISNREAELGRTQDPMLRQQIELELQILRRGTGDSAGRISNIVSNQIAFKEWELQQETNPLRRRRIERELEALRNRLGTASAREREFAGGVPVIRPHAVFVNEEDGQTFPLLIEIGQLSHSVTRRVYTYRISDVSTPNGDNYEAEGPTPAAAVRNAIVEMAGHFPYGRGFVTVQIPSHAPYRLTETTFRCNPRGTAQARERLDELIQALSILGLFVAPVGLAAAALGAAVALNRLLSRAANHTFQWDLEAVSDMVSILGAVASGASRIASARVVRTANMYAIVGEDAQLANILAGMSRTARIAEFVDDFFNWGGFAIGQMQAVIQYNQIQEEEASGAISHAEARRRRARVISQAAFDHAMQFGGPHISEAMQNRGQGGEQRQLPPGDEQRQLPPGEERRQLPPGDGTQPHPPGDGTQQHPPHGQGQEPRRQGSEPEGEGGGLPLPVPLPGGDGHQQRPHDSGSQGGGSTAERNQRAQRFLENPEHVNRLLGGDAATIEAFLREHGVWRDLMMYLQQRGGEYATIAEVCGRHRDGIVRELDRRFGARLSDPNASVEAASDVDLATSGNNAGQQLLAAERHMRDTYGPHWSEMFRMNFYTEGERLFVYERVRGQMSTEAFGAMQSRFSSQAEVLNFAKMLQHAQGNAESAARVEQMMGHLPAEVRERIRTLAAETPAQAQRRVQELHLQIDRLMAQFNQLPENDPNRPALAEQITSLQMEANFRTQEAYISPGAARQAVRSVAVTGHEAYQAALANLEMIEHILHGTHGDVGMAVREYEMYKYVNRLIVAMVTGGLRPNAFMLNYLQISHDLYRNSRTALQGVNARDLSFLRAMHTQFVTEAQQALQQLSQRAQASPGDWNAQHNSLDAPRRGPMTHVGDRTQPRPEGQGDGPTDAEIDASLDATFGQGGGTPPNPPPNPPPPPPGGPGPQPPGPEQPQAQGPDPRAPQTGSGTPAAPAVTPGQRTPNDWTAGTPAGNLLRSGTQHRGGNLPAEGGPPNGVLFKADEQGRYTNYTVYDEHGRAIKRVDLTGASHGGVPTPHVVLYRHNYAPNGRVSVNAERRVRPARTDEIP